MVAKNVNYVALGKRIHVRRQQLGLSQSAAAEKLDLSTSFYSRVERGEKVASLETLTKIANCFDSSLDFLLQDSLHQGVSESLRAELTQVFAGKKPEQCERLVKWLRVLSSNIDVLY